MMVYVSGVGGQSMTDSCVYVGISGLKSEFVPCVLKMYCSERMWVLLLIVYLVWEWNGGPWDRTMVW